MSGKRCWLFRAGDKQIFVGDEAIQAAMSEGWTDKPVSAGSQLTHKKLSKKAAKNARK